MTLNVPRSLFHGPDVELIPEEVVRFGEQLQSRYPWLSNNALSIIMENACKEMRRVLWEEKRGAVAGRELASRGLLQESISHLRKHVADNPEDVDAWYALGEALCKAGEQEEGYEAFRHGRSLFRP
ncbi:MAG: tetratricopeptide repeat protein [Candidatus Methanomethylophilaceae archaeon]|nr:tetratricopeptide repeat protein [Candidatus Methanomethylophilaceae archaeon]